MKITKRKYIIYILLIVAFLSMGVVSTIYAKYVSSGSGSGLIKPESFYFTSSYDDNQTYEIYDNKITIQISNSYLDEYTKKDIDYTITVKSNGELVGTIINGTLTGNTKSTENVEIEVQYDKTYDVTIQTSKPYVKTITHKFKTYSDYIASYYTLTNYDGYIELDLYIGTTLPSKITINYNDKLSADNTNVLMDDWFSTIGVIYNNDLINNAHFKLVFFKKDSYTYDNIVNGSFVVSADEYSVTITK